MLKTASLKCVTVDLNSNTVVDGINFVRTQDNRDVLRIDRCLRNCPDRSKFGHAEAPIEIKVPVNADITMNDDGVSGKFLGFKVDPRIANSRRDMDFESCGTNPTFSDNTVLVLLRYKDFEETRRGMQEKNPQLVTMSGIPDDEGVSTKLYYFHSGMTLDLQCSKAGCDCGRDLHSVINDCGLIKLTSEKVRPQDGNAYSVIENISI